MKIQRSEVPLSVQVIAGTGGMVLVVAIVLLGTSRLNRGTWGAFSDTPWRVLFLGVAIIIGSALLNALHQHRG